MADFAGKIVVVSGGSRGIGYGIAKAFASQGALTVLAASSESNLRSAADTIAKAGPRPDTVAGDLRQAAGCTAVFDFVRDRHGGCDVLVNCAGAAQAGAFLDLPDEAWNDGFDLKFFACVRLCRLFWLMLKAARGSVINISGGAARTPDAGFLIGGSVNAAMANFTKGLAGLGSRDGVNVNCVLPGMIATERVGRLMEQRAKAEGITAEEMRTRMIAKEGVRRLGKPEDVAALVLFLCSAEAQHIQGTSISVDGGATPGVC